MSKQINPTAFFNNFTKQLFSPTHSAGLNVYRIGFGIIMIWEAWRFLYFDKVFTHWLEPTFFFKYPLFHWVHPLPGQWMYVHIVAIGILGILITLGLFYRAAMILMFIGFTYIFLLDATYYLNHFYLICLVSFIMIFMPLNRGWSLDALWFDKSLRSPTIPRWSLWLLRFQIGVPYFFGGIAKINKDWLRGEPMHMWLSDRTDYPIFGSFADTWWLAYVFSYGGLLLDLLAVPFLLWKPTRFITFLVLVFFHFTNAWIFNIGVFPWMMLIATTVFFKPNWPIQLFNDFKKPAMRFIYILSALIFTVIGGYCSTTWQYVPMLVSAFTGAVCVWLFRDQFFSNQLKHLHIAALPPTKVRGLKLTIVLISIWVLIQSLFPLRHFTHSNWVHWSDHGNYFAWRMKLRDKEGNVRFWVTDQSGKSIELAANELGLTDYQSLKILTRPYLIHQTAYYIQDKFEAEGFGDVQVFANHIVSLNGREAATLVDPYVDLTKVPLRVGKFTPVLELTEPLRPK